jgi:hypothetical protein
LWQELIQQAKNNEQLEIPLPTTNDIALSGKEKETIALLDQLTDPDLPNALRIDFNVPTSMDYSVNQFGTFRTRTIKLTLLAYAISKRNHGLMEYFIKLGVPLLAPNTTNPLIAMLKKEEVAERDQNVFAAYVDQIITKYPQLLTIGDADGELTLSDKTEDGYVHDFKPQFLIIRNGHAPVLTVFHKHGLALDVSQDDELLIVKASKKHLDRVVKYIVENTPKDEITYAKCIETYINHSRRDESEPLYKILQVRSFYKLTL